MLLNFRGKEVDSISLIENDWFSNFLFKFKISDISTSRFNNKFSKHLSFNKSFSSFSLQLENFSLKTEAEFL